MMAAGRLGGTAWATAAVGVTSIEVTAVTANASFGMWETFVIAHPFRAVMKNTARSAIGR
jgi:hypothetical protein